MKPSPALQDTVIIKTKFVNYQVQSRSRFISRIYSSKKLQVHFNFRNYKMNKSSNYNLYA